MQRIGVTTGGQRVSTREVFEAPGEAARALYMHVPFCAHKCHYCDFYSIVSDSRTLDEFTDVLCKELEVQSRRAGRLRTIFVGGGTPTLLPKECWSRVLETVHEWYDCSAVEEWTVESNPDTSDPELLGVLAEGGVTRISIGVQSFAPELLRFLERTHEPSNVAPALRAASAAGIERCNADLIFGIPGQTQEMWRADLEAVVALDPGADHISCYALTYEAGTALTKRMERGECAVVSEADEVAMLETAIEVLGAHGLERYEVSNFARSIPSGRACAHNMAYWRCESCLAVGPSASGYLRAGPSGSRWTNTRSLREWMASVEANGYAHVDVLELPEVTRTLRERLMLGMRIVEGVPRDVVNALAVEVGCAETLMGVIERSRKSGLIAIEEDCIRPTVSGLRVADSLATELMGAVQSAGAEGA